MGFFIHSTNCFFHTQYKLFLSCAVQTFSYAVQPVSFLRSLEALDPNAYEAYQASRDLEDVVRRVLVVKENNSSVGTLTKTLSIKANLMTPVLLMLVRASNFVILLS